MMTTARGDNDYVAIPAFISRVFRQSGIYVRTDRGIATPQDLRGRIIGVPEYQITANVWIRGILQDEHGVRPEEIGWRRGGVEEPGRGERAPIDLGPGIDLRQIPDDKTLSGMLEHGEIDGYIGARAPSCLGAPNVGRLYGDDYIEAEKAYFRRSGIFPIMHMVGIRKSLAAAHPWLPVSVYKAFIKAKELAVRDLGEICHLAATLPWMVHHLDEARALMGQDFWPYGLEANRHAIDTFRAITSNRAVQAARGARGIVRAVGAGPVEDLSDHESARLPLPGARHAGRSAAAAGREQNARVLAGGQSLVAMLNMRFAFPDCLIDINRVAELAYLRESDGGIEIGAMTRQRDVEFSPLVARRLPLWREAILQVGHRQTRNGAPSAAACASWIRPPSCRPWRWRWTPN